MERCNHVHVLMGPCVLPLGHQGLHETIDGKTFKSSPLRDYHEAQKILTEPQEADVPPRRD